MTGFSNGYRSLLRPFHPLIIFSFGNIYLGIFSFFAHLLRNLHGGQKNAQVVDQKLQTLHAHQIFAPPWPLMTMCVYLRLWGRG